MPSPQALLSSVFGFDAFRPGQEEIVEAVTAGRDVLAIMPTGGREIPVLPASRPDAPKE